VVMEG